MSIRSCWRSIAVLLTLLVLVSGCQGGARLAPNGVADWSRGLMAGRAILNGPVGLAAAPRDRAIHLAWVASADDGVQRLQVARVEEDGSLTATVDLPIEVNRPEQVELELGAPGELHLFWVDRLDAGRAVRHALLRSGGVVIGAPRTVSTAGLDASSYTAEPDDEGGATVVWSADVEGAPQLVATTLGADGSPVATHPLELSGSEPVARREPGGALHLVWVSEPDYGRREIRYAALDPEAWARPEERVLATFPLPTGLILRPPSLGVTAGRVYVFWSVERRGGGLAGPSADSYVVTLRRDAPEEVARPQAVVIPAARDVRYEALPNELGARYLAAAPTGALAAPFIYFASAAEPRGEDLPVAFAVQLSGRTRAANQIVLTLWRDGDLFAYQAVTNTTGISLRPNLRTTEEGHLAVAWIDTAGFGAFDVYVAGTSPAMREHLNRTRPQDVAEAVLDGLWGVVQALAFVPVVLMWFVPSLVLLVLYALLQPEGDLERTGPRIALLGAGALYVAFKYLLRPGWLLELSLPHWVPAPVVEIALVAVPLAILAVAGAATLIYARRGRYPSLFPAFLLFAGSDALLTLLIYVPATLAE